MDVLIVDDHPFIHETLAAVVGKAMPGASVFSEVDLTRAVALARRIEDLRLVLLDLGLPGCDGIDALHFFRKALPSPRVAIVSAIEDPECMREALDAGACGYIPKTSLPSVIVAALRLIADGGIYVPPQAIATPLNSRAARLALTQRQSDVLRLLMKGLANKQIAQRLEISEDTVKQHAHAVFEKLGVSSRMEAAAAAGRLGLKP